MITKEAGEGTVLAFAWWSLKVYVIPQSRLLLPAGFQKWVLSKYEIEIITYTLKYGILNDRNKHLMPGKLDTKVFHKLGQKNPKLYVSTVNYQT